MLRVLVDSNNNVQFILGKDVPGSTGDKEHPPQGYVETYVPNWVTVGQNINTPMPATWIGAQ